MSDHNWSTILKKQDQFVHQQNKIQQQRKHRIKQLYKNQLQKIIQYQRNHSLDQKQYDRKLVNYASQQEKRRMMRQRKQLQYRYRTNQQIARDNLRSNQQKKSKEYLAYTQQKKIYAERYNRALTQAKQQTQSRIQHRQQQKSQLAKVYDNQLKFVQTRKKLEKLQDQKFTKLLLQIQQKKQENRRLYFQKLRNGYRQNPEVYQNSATQLIKNQQQRNQFIKKFASQNPFSFYQQEKKIKQQENAKKIKQTSQFNKKYYQNKMLNQQYQSLQEINHYNGRYKTMMDQMESQKEMQFRQAQMKRKKLKMQLDRQILESRMKKNLNSKMDDNQYLLNRSGNVPALPGLVKDYAAQKQQRILESFLKGSSKKLQSS